MNIELKKVLLEDKHKLENLMQLYLHDLSLYFPIEFNSTNCKYEYSLDKYFEKNVAYFIMNSNNILGFILIDINDYSYEISEIFVLNNYKKNKIGEKAVLKVFDMYKGNWIIKVVPLSNVAESFWTNTIKKYTNDFKLEYTGKYNRAMLTFKN